jgi:shikimate dehydrogenase
VADGRTRLAAVIGCPVRHSLSPAIHNAAFTELGLNWTFVALEVPEGAGGAAVAAVRTLGLGGLSVTMPHKEAAVAAVDRLSPTAARLQAVNCVAVGDGGELIGENTDGAGFVDALRHAAAFDPAGSHCAVLGAGGAARAVILALAEAGAGRVTVVNRTPPRAVVAAQLAGDRGVVHHDLSTLEADLLVNATSVGMGADQRLPVPFEVLRPTMVVADLVYHPLETPLLAAARQAGATAVDGLGMLVHQAAHAFGHWTGRPAPVEAMRTAALAELEATGNSR